MSCQVNFIITSYNEEKIFNELIKRLDSVMLNSKLSIEVILIDDGSIDNTPILMEGLSKKDGRFQSVFLSRNFGHQLSLSAGLSHAYASDAVFILDGDLQDPPELIDQFYDELKNGFDVVYGVRSKRKESFFKKLAYKTFYRLLKRVSYINIPLDSGDFSLISMRVVKILTSMNEESRFLRGMRSWIGFKQKGIVYERDERKMGESKYSLKKLISLAFNGLFNFSEFPVRFITRLGIFTTFSSSIYLLYALYARFVLNEVPEGFTGIIFLITLLGGVQLISIGLIGEYILRIFFQTKQRPLFLVKRIIKNKNSIGEELL